MESLIRLEYRNFFLGVGGGGGEYNDTGHFYGEHILRVVWGGGGKSIMTRHFYGEHILRVVGGGGGGKSIMTRHFYGEHILRVVGGGGAYPQKKILKNRSFEVKLVWFGAASRV